MPAPSVTKVYAIHGVLMAVTWLGLGPFAAVTSRYLKQAVGSCGLKPAWFVMHRGIGVVVFMLTVAGFTLINAEVSVHFAGNHQRVGLVVTILTLLQPLNAFLRPGMPKAAGAKPSLLRAAWAWGHKLLGWMLLALAAVNCLLGAQINDTRYGDGATWYNTTLGIILVWLVAIALLEVRRICLATKMSANETMTLSSSVASAGVKPSGAGSGSAAQDELFSTFVAVKVTNRPSKAPGPPTSIPPSPVTSKM